MDKLSVLSREHLVFWFLFSVALVSAVTDYQKGKIYNWVTIPVMGLGFFWAALHGLDAVWNALGGWGVALAVFFPLFLTGIMGAGDAKLVMAFGTFLGPRGTLEIIFWSFVIGGLASVVLLVMHKRVKIFTREIIKFFRTLLTPGLALQWPKLSRDIKAPFGVAIFMGLLAQRVWG